MTQFTSIKQVKAHIDAQIEAAQVKLAELTSGMAEQEIDSMVVEMKQACADFAKGKSDEFVTSNKFDKACAISAERIMIENLKETKESDLMITNCRLNRFQVPEGYNLISPAGFHHEVDNVFCLVAK